MMMELDADLLRQIENLSDGENIHYLLNLIAGYRSSVDEFHDSGNRQYIAIAEEAERALRIYLFELRLKKFFLLLKPENPT